MLSIKPQSISPATIAALQKRLKTLTDAIVHSLDPRQPYEEFTTSKNNLEIALKEVKHYGRLLRVAGHLQHVDVDSLSFDDHDQVSSMLLYLVSEYEQQKTAGRGWSPRILRNRVMPHWSYVSPTNAQQCDTLLWKEPRISSCDIGILTVLEHEYQSVVRRLDSIVECTEDTSCGFGILDRMHSTDDMKDTSVTLGSGAKTMGWTTGTLGGHKVIVVCTGYAGKDKANECKLEAQRLFGIPQVWLVVGICAGSNDQWPIGTVLVSNELVCSITDPSPHKYVVEREIHPFSLPTPLPERFTLHQAFRRTPHGCANNTVAANPEAVPVRAVNFACTRDVINVSAAKAAIRACLTNTGNLAAGADFGIEMEGPGVAAYTERTMCIIKGVCDYADEKKEQWKETHAQVLFQLYAAETAADYAVQTIRQMRFRA